MLFKNKALIILAFLAVIMGEIKVGGQLLNLLAMKVNGDKMPVLTEESKFSGGVFSDPARHSHPLVEGSVKSVRLAFLCDIFTVNRNSLLGKMIVMRLAPAENFPDGFKSTYLFLSYGDFLIFGGGILSATCSDATMYGFIVWRIWVYFRRRRAKSKN